MTYRIFHNSEGYWFQCRSALAVRHGPFPSRAAAKTAADEYVAGW